MIDLHFGRGSRGFCLAAALIASLAPPAAAVSEATLRATFDVLDADGDGVVQQTEYEIHKVQVLFGNDANGDGRLTPEETPNLSAEAFARLDEDGDGQLSGVELLLAPELQFLAIDRDGDGVVTFEEFEALVARITQ